MQAQVLEKYQNKESQQKKEEPALVAFKLKKPLKSETAGLYTIQARGKGNNVAKYLLDPQGRALPTESPTGSKQPYRVDLLDELACNPKEISLNEQIFDSLQMETQAWDCCKNGKNLTIFSLEDFGKKDGLSSVFSGNMKQRGEDSGKKSPSTIRTTVESIFAHIFQNKVSEFVLRMSYLEINEEQVYDLLNEGKQIFQNEDMRYENCLNIDSTMQMKAKGDASRLQNQFVKYGDHADDDAAQESTLILKFVVENLSKEKVRDYEMMLNEQDLEKI